MLTDTANGWNTVPFLLLYKSDKHRVIEICADQKRLWWERLEKSLCVAAGSRSDVDADEGSIR